jgi:hypothetical protein
MHQGISEVLEKYSEWQLCELLYLASELGRMGSELQVAGSEMPSDSTV